MIRCTFHLNGGQLSTLSCPGVGFFPAYSGHAGANRNNPDSVALKKKGPCLLGNISLLLVTVEVSVPVGTICSKNLKVVQTVTFGLHFTGTMGFSMTQHL